MAVEVAEVTSRRGMRQFIRYPLRLYAGDPCFVPHLLIERRRFFSPSNPLFEFIERRYFLARDESGAAVGRISAHVNRRHNEFWSEKAGFFGFFECAERPEAAGALLGAAEQWLGQKGMTVIRGPLSFSTNEECGCLVEGFDSPPVFMMPYGKRYYADFISGLGYGKAKDLLAYDYQYPGAIPEHMVRFSERVRERSNVTVRTLNTRDFEQEIRLAFGVYNRAWARNWGFVPMTDRQFAHMARSLKSIIDPSVVLIAEADLYAE